MQRNSSSHCSLQRSALRKGDPHAGPLHPAASTILGADRELPSVDVAGRMHLEALYALVHEGEEGAPHRLDDRPLLEHDLLKFSHDHPTLLDLERAFRLGEQLVKLR